MPLRKNIIGRDHENHICYDDFFFSRVFYYSYSLTSQKLIDIFDLSAAPFFRFLGFGLLESDGSS